ncbi:MAG: glycosyltransferase family 4 protein [Bacteroidia bacterium]|jgi:glycosyltransferase involved in cell wall biosynthesis
MRIAVNTRLLIKGKMEGIAWYTYETLSRITRQHPEHEFYFLFDRPFSADFKFSDNVKCIWMPPPTRHIRLFSLWFEWAVPFMLKRVKADVFLSPDGHLSLATRVPSLAVIHDLNFHHMPESLPPAVRDYYNHWFPKFAQKAARIATVSQYTKNDLISSYGISADKIDLTYNGFNSRYTPLDAQKQHEVRLSLTDGIPYFLFVGLIIPRKNLVRLMQAYDQYRKNGAKPVKLVVVGESKWWDSEHQRAFEAMEYKSDVVFTGRLEPQRLSDIMASALALAYVPVFEGFGIPILEAFASGTPVITSNVTSMPEVAGDAAHLVNPYDVDDIAAGLHLMAQSDELSAAFRKKGLERATNFSWDHTANALWDSIMRI